MNPIFMISGRKKTLFPILHYLNFILGFILYLSLRIKRIDSSKNLWI